MGTVIQHYQTQANLFLPGLVQLNFPRVITQAAGHWPHCPMVPTLSHGLAPAWCCKYLASWTAPAPPCSLVSQLIIYTHINLSDTLKVLFD